VPTRRFRPGVHFLERGEQALRHDHVATQAGPTTRTRDGARDEEAGAVISARSGAYASYRSVSESGHQIK